MSSSTIVVDDRIDAYLLKQGRPESETAAALREATAPMPAAMMQVSPLQGAFMSWLVGFMNVENALEVGTFTGYSALCVAEALPDHGKLIACDVSEEWTRMAKEYWERGGVAHKIDLQLRPAAETLDSLISDEREGSFDFAFIDADKPNYDVYYERCLQLLRVGGIVAVDNVLWGGRAANKLAIDESTRAIRALNKKIQNDDRVSNVMLPIGDGLTLATKL